MRACVHEGAGGLGAKRSDRVSCEASHVIRDYESAVTLSIPAYFLAVKRRLASYLSVD